MPKRLTPAEDAIRQVLLSHRPAETRGYMAEFETTFIAWCAVRSCLHSIAEFKRHATIANGLLYHLGREEVVLAVARDYLLACWTRRKHLPALEEVARFAADEDPNVRAFALVAAQYVKTGRRGVR